MQSKKIIKVLCLILSLGFLFNSAFSTYAASTKALNEKKARIQQEINETEKKIQTLKGKKEDTEEYISTLEKKIQLKQDQIDVLQKDADKLQARITTIKNNIAKAESEINAIQKEIDRKQKAFDKTFDAYCKRLRAIYVSGNTGSLEVLLTSDDISSILTRSQMVKSVSQKDSDALEQLQKQMDEIQKGKADLEAKRNQLKVDKAELQKDKSKLDAQISKINSSKKELTNEVAECNSLIKSYNKQNSEYLETIAENKEEIEKVEREIQSIIAERSKKYSNSNIGPSSNLINAKGNGTFCYPTDYRAISSGFYRRSGAFHGAIDFPCPVGSNVYAGAAGTVIDATTGWGGGYGNRVFIDHHNGFVTIYGHNSKLLVREGQTVKRGQLIALSGNTGHSTGPHCHFEVRLNGTKVNPANYL